MSFLRAWPVALALAFCGCTGKTDGPNMGAVSGVVTLDSKPVSGAVVTFIPQVEAGMQSGSTSIGITDEQGRYELQYSNAEEGAVVGKHLVRISTFRDAEEDENGKLLPGQPETIPAQYNRDASGNQEMIKDVKAGKNEIDFALKGGGTIVQPPKAVE